MHWLQQHTAYVEHRSLPDVSAPLLAPHHDPAQLHQRTELTTQILHCESKKGPLYFCP